MLTRKRVDWISHRSEIVQLIEAGAALADVALALNCSPNTASAGLRRLGLRIDPEAAHKRRVDLMARVGSDPAAVDKRTRKLKRTLRLPKVKAVRSANAKRQWQDDDVRARTIEGLKAAAARLTPEDRSARSAMAGAAKLAWCLQEYRDEYARLRRRLGSAKEAKRIVLEQLAKEGRARKSV